MKYLQGRICFLGINVYLCAHFVPPSPSSMTNGRTGRKYLIINLLIFSQMAEYLQAEKKQEIFAKYGKSNTDTGSPESQVALFSYRIAHLTEHLKNNKKDFATRRSLLKLVGKRRRVLDYLKEIDIERYRNIVKELGLRR